VTADPADRGALELVPPHGGSGIPRIEISGNLTPSARSRPPLAAGAIPDLYVTAGRPVRIEKVSGTTSVDLDDDAPYRSP